MRRCACRASELACGSAGLGSQIDKFGNHHLTFPVEVMTTLAPHHRAEISKFLQRAKGGMLVQSIEGLHNYMLSHHLAWRQVLTCDLVGVHPANRDGVGCSSTHVHELISNIAAIGYVASELRAVCLEVPPADTQVRAFNDRLVAEAAGKLAPAPDNLRYASIVGSHTNQAFRAFWCGIPHSDPKLTVDGVLSLDKLAVLDCAWATSIRDGVPWLVISHQIAEEFPDYPGLAQAAGNASGQIASVENELQLARKVNAAIADVVKHKAVQQASYAEVAPAILRSRPPNASALPAIFQFVVKCGGGAHDGSYLSRTERFIRSHGYVNRALGADVWTALAADIRGAPQRVPFRHMLLKLALAGPDKCVSHTDVKRALAGKDSLQKVAEAEKIFADVQSRLQHIGGDQEKDLGHLEMQLAAIVLGKRKVAKHEALQDPAHELLLSHGLQSPWTPTPAPAAAASSSSTPSGPCPGLHAIYSPCTSV